jgi:acetyl esterase/lipase
MKPSNRRTFIKLSSLCLGALGIDPFKAVAHAALPAGKRLEIRQKTQNLWKDGSINNWADSLKRPKIDFFIPETPGNKKRAAILVLPGGGYAGLAAHEGAPFARLFAEKGIVGIVLTYRVSPNRHPAPFADAARAIRLIRGQCNELNIDPQRIGILGFSAGGHLASTVATQPDLYKDPEDELAATISARPDRVMLGYPVISFREFAHKGSVGNLLGTHQPPELLDQLSNQKQVNAATPPAFLFHTAEDKGVPVQNSLLFANACVEHKVPVALHIYPHGGHGVGMAANNAELNEWPQVLLKWLYDWQIPV